VLRDDGSRYWGIFGAAGLVAFDPERGILLQHRVEWSHHGGTWGIPGGARHQLETAAQAALREAAEEAAVPIDSIDVLFEFEFNLDFWSYTTIVGIVTNSFEAVVTDAESNELRWVNIDEVETLELHPGFASSWPEIRNRLQLVLAQRDA
jgi:8-oxo-dGTP diphosphatase